MNFAVTTRQVSLCVFSRKGFIGHIEMRVVRSILDNLLEEIPKPEALVASDNSAATNNLVLDYVYDYKRGPQARYNYPLGPFFKPFQ